MQPMSGPKGRTAALRDPPGGRLRAVHADGHQGRIADLRCARKLNWEIEVSGRSGLRSSFSDVQMQLTAAWSPILQMLQVALVTG